LPEGWKYQKLKTLIKMHYGKALKAVDRIQGDVPVYGSNGIVGSHNEHLWSQPTVIIGRKGSVGEANLSLTPSWTIDTAYYVEVIDQEVLDLMYFYYFADRFDVSSISQKGVKPGINRNDYLNVSFPLPPLKEQKRIVEKLDALLIRIDTAIEHLQESVALADALSQNGLDVYFAELTKTNPELPLSKLADFISGYAFKSGDFTSESGINPIKITNFGVNEFYENAEEFLPASYESEYQRFAAKANDIVIALTRPIINGGLKVCRVPESYSGALVNQRVAAITSHNEHVLEFIYLYLQSSHTKSYVLEKSKSLNQPNLSITDLKNLEIPFPNNDEAIVKAVSDCNALISKARKSKAEISEKITMMQQLKASILDSAFKGEL
jgi:type I restriction enzyme S subunit